MAVTLKRKRGTVSYREPSSDEDLASDPDSENLYRTKRALPVRRSTRHRSTEAEPPPPLLRRDTSPTKTAAVDERRTSRRGKNRNLSYKDVSSDEDVDMDFDAEEVVEQRRPQTRTVQSPRPRRNEKPKKKSGPSSGRNSRKMLGAPLKPRILPQSSTPVQIPTDGHQPAWATLPYHVLLQIFVYASHPLHDENMAPYPSISWLAQVACICSAFTKPALTALYRNPPIFAIKHNRRDLVNHFISPPVNAYVDYRVMVKRLELDAIQMASSTDPTHSATDLAALVAALTTIKEIDIFDPLDRPPYRGALRHVRRWHYPLELFSALRQSDLRLRSWRWNSTFCTQGPLWMREIHADNSFQSLRDLTLTKFDPKQPQKLEEGMPIEPTTEELLGTALAALPNLQHLAFESCKVVNGRLLPLLPTTLFSLNLTNCIYLISEDLQAFLASHGQHLEELILNHNQSLDLSYLVDLKRSCPRLEVLRMDLNYYSSLVMSSDNEPLYDWLLGLDEIPTWPSTLRVIDMEYLRKWGSDAATNFFSSLIDSANELPWLRELRILAMVDVDWRQRADFRRKWAARFEKVFASRHTPPSPHLASLKAYREWKVSRLEATEKNDSLLGILEENKMNELVKNDSGSDTPLLPRRKKKVDERWNPQRLRSRAKASANYDETSDTGSGSDDASNIEEEPYYIQGRCHTVIFRIDNLRPREELYDEGDFLDEERSGDEEWNGNEDDDEAYAW